MAFRSEIFMSYIWDEEYANLNLVLGSIKENQKTRDFTGIGLFRTISQKDQSHVKTPTRRRKTTRIECDQKRKVQVL